IADRLTVERFRIVADGRLPRVQIVRVHPRDLDRHLAQQMLELIDRAAVERRRGHDVIAWLEHREERPRLRGDPARKCDGAASTLEVGDTLLEDRHRGIHDPRIGIAVFLQIEVRSRRLGILEHVTGGLKNRYGARTGVRIRTLSGVYLSRLESELA